MNEPINIPLSIDPTRQATWRVVHVVGSIAALSLAAWIVARGVATYDRTLKLLPAETDLAVRILKTTDSTRLANTHLAGLAALPGAPWSMSDLIASSRRGVNIASVGDETMLIIDRELPNIVNEARASGFFALADDGLTVIATDSALLSTQKTLPDLAFALMFARNDGLLIDATGHGAPFNIDKNEITLKGVELFSASSDDAMLVENMDIYATLQTSQAVTKAFGLVAPAENTPGAQALAHLLTSAGTSITIGRDADGIAYSFVVPIAENMLLSNDDFVAIGKEILEIPELSLERLVLPDGTVVSELRSSAAEVSVVDEHPYSFVTVASASKKVIIARTSDSIRITNRPIEPSEETSRITSECLHRAKAWIRPSELLADVPSTTAHRAMTITSLFAAVTEISVGNNTSRICW